MAEIKKVDIFFVLGWVVGVAFLLDLAANLGDPFEFLWYCSFAAFFLVVGLFRKDTFLLTAVLVTAVPAQSLWIADFVLQAFGKGFGRTEHILTVSPFIYWTALFLHVLLIPVSFFSVWKLGFYRRALPLTLACFSSLLAASYVLTEPSLNHNCVFYPCDANDPGFGYLKYFLIYSLVSWNVIVTVSFYGFKFLFKSKLVDKAR